MQSFAGTPDGDHAHGLACSHIPDAAMGRNSVGRGHRGIAFGATAGRGDAKLDLPHRLARGFISFYKRFIAPFLPGRCRFYPSCSQYAMECFTYLPFWQALGKSLWRIARCNPLSRGYFDPVFPEEENHNASPRTSR